MVGIYIRMNKKIIINKNQLNVIVEHLNEVTLRASTVNKIKDDLDLNYEPQVVTKRKGGEYFEDAGFRIKADDSLTDGKSLLRYLSMKYPDVGEAFLKQVIRDWADDAIDDGMLTTKVSVSE